MSRGTRAASGRRRARRRASGGTSGSARGDAARAARASSRGARAAPRVIGSGESVGHLEQEVVGVSEDHGPAERGEPVEHLARLGRRPARRRRGRRPARSRAARARRRPRRAPCRCRGCPRRARAARLYDRQTMSVRVRMAPSPTGALHIGGVRTALFNWLFARNQGGEFLVRIENTDTSREVAEAVDQMRSTRSRGSGSTGTARRRSSSTGSTTAGASPSSSSPTGRRTRTRARSASACPTRATTSWDDAVRGEISFPNESLEDLVLVRADGRPTYNFASPMEDVWDGITHVIRGEDHVSNTPKQINIIRAVGAELPVYAHVPNVIGRRRQEAVEATRRDRRRRVARAGYYAHALLELPRAARLGARRRDDDHEPRRADRALQPRARESEPGAVRLRQARLDERRLPARAAARRVRATCSSRYLARAGLRLGRAARSARPRRSCRRRSRSSASFPAYAGFLFHDVQPDPAELDGGGRGRRGGARRARRARAVHGRVDRGRAARACSTSSG